METRHELGLQTVHSALRDSAILIIDDELADRKVLTAKLKSTDETRNILGVDSECGAREVLANQSFDCVLLDFHLGAKTSEKLLSYICENYPFLPVVSLSGAGDENKAVSALKLGAADYLPKGNASEHALDRAVTNAMTKFRLASSLEKERQELIAVNKVLIRQQREIQSFYHTVSHELKTPITAIREFSSLLRDGILGDINESQVDALDTSIGCCDRLNRLVNDLFDTARLETGKLQLNLEAIDLAKVISQEATIMSPLAQHKSISLSLAECDDSIELIADPVRIGQVLANLINNAIKYTPSGGRIKVRARVTGDSVCVDVEDNGYGVSEENAELIFERMYQCGTEPTGEPSSQGGMGIGLFLCQQIVKLHGGQLSLRSEHGAGSVFTFTLPLST